MGIWSQDVQLPYHDVIVSTTTHAGVMGEYTHRQSNNSGTFPAANTALFYPIRIARAVSVKTLFTFNAAVVSGNIDVGIYDTEGNRLVSSGSAAQVGINTLQVTTLGSTLFIPRGLYFLAVAMDNTTGTLMFYGMTIPMIPGYGIRAQVAAFPLPATATYATASALNFAAHIGCSSRSFI